MRKASSALLPVISVDRSARRPLHRQIYESFRANIVEGNLTPGQQVPSTRALAAELKVSRIPVLAGYAQLLAEGYFEARVGAGTFVCRSLPDQVAAGERREMSAAPRRSAPRRIADAAQAIAPHTPLPWMHGLGAFCLGQPAYDGFPFQIWSSIVSRHARNPRASELHYSGPIGLERLRNAICNYLRTARAVRCDPRQVMIVSGSQQALDISARVLLNPGDSAWMEEPGYWMARRVLKAGGAKIVPVPVDAEGLDVAVGIERCRSAKAAFVVPSHQFPLGVTMSAARRLQLLDWAESSGAWVIEDDYDSEYRYDSMPIASLQGLDESARVIYIGTFSKILFPSLRIGYVVIPEDLVDRFAAIRNLSDLGPPHLYQAVLSDFIEEGHFARHIRRMRLLYSERRNALVESIRGEFGNSLKILGAEAGIHLVATLPRGVRDVEMAQRAVQEKLWLAPLSSAYLEAAPQQGFILGFGGTPVSGMPAAVRRMKALLAGRAKAPLPRRIIERPARRVSRA
jgi:GntR family transcriptional regulator / MocR family aminotransferase